MLSESQLLGWFFLDHKKRVISFLSSEAAERYEQPGVFDELIRGAERPKCFLLRRRFHCGERDRLVDLASGRVGATGVCTADTMLGAAIRIAMRSAHMQRAQLISIYPSPRVSLFHFSVARQVLLSLMLLTPGLGPRRCSFFRNAQYCVTSPNPLQ